MGAGAGDGGGVRADLEGVSGGGAGGAGDAWFRQEYWVRVSWMARAALFDRELIEDALDSWFEPLDL